MSEHDNDEILRQIKHIINFFKLKTKESSDMSEIHIKHHPEECEQNIEKINAEFKKTYPKNTKIVFINKSKLLSRDSLQLFNGIRHDEHKFSRC